MLISRASAPQFFKLAGFSSEFADAIGCPDVGCAFAAEDVAGLMAVGITVVMLVATNELATSEKFDGADGVCNFHLSVCGAVSRLSSVWGIPRDIVKQGGQFFCAGNAGPFTKDQIKRMD